MPDDLTLTDEELDQLVGAIEVSVPHTEPRLRTRNELVVQFPRQSFTTNCPACRQALVLKDGRRGVFYGCQNFPACRGTINANQETGAPLVPATTPSTFRRSQVGAWARPTVVVVTPSRNYETGVRELVHMAKEEKAKRKKDAGKAPPPRVKTRFDLIDED